MLVDGLEAGNGHVGEQGIDGTVAVYIYRYGETVFLPVGFNLFRGFFPGDGDDEIVFLCGQGPADGVHQREFPLAIPAFGVEEHEQGALASELVGDEGIALAIAHAEAGNGVAHVDAVDDAVVLVVLDAGGNGEKA